jgi:putative component of toxin-antitoxin plasmid stabilization module
MSATSKSARLIATQDGLAHYAMSGPERELIILLSWGDKSRQQADIKDAQQLARDWKV